ncbi:MAG TPA: helix-turn-helix transcriptional regulator [Lysobacter sp.]
MSLRRPLPALRPFVESVWASAASTQSVAPREHVLPCNRMHLAIRLDGALRLYRDADDTRGETIASAVVAGTRAGFYVKDTATPSRSVGVILKPGASQALFGCSADELTASHVPLEALWGKAAHDLHAQLLDEDEQSRQLELLQRALLARLRPVRAMHPAIAQTMQGLEQGHQVSALAQASGCSHRLLLARFRAATGLAPKAYARVLRFRHALNLLASGQRLVDVAHDAGYSDQAHFSREFRELSGVTPQAYRRAPVRAGAHVGMVNFLQDAGRPRP